MLRVNTNKRFDSYDPRYAKKGRSNYDPRVNNYNGNGGANTQGSGYQTQSADPGNKMQINLLFNNATLSDLTFEAFNWIDSFMKRIKAEYAVANYLYIPQTSYEGILALAAGTDQTVGFDQQGNCVIRALLAAPVGTLSCKEVAYQSLFDASGIAPFTVSGIRYKSSNDAQKDEKIVHFTKSFSGGVLENPINPRAFEKPTDQKENLIDIPVKLDIKIDTGLRMKVLAGQSVTLSMFIDGWTNQTL